LIAEISASEAPVLPLVASMIVPPCLSPSASACLTISAAIRSLWEPPGLRNSAFT
jgi:hypothetical protein